MIIFYCSCLWIQNINWVLSYTSYSFSCSKLIYIFSNWVFDILVKWMIKFISYEDTLSEIRPTSSSFYFINKSFFFKEHLQNLIKFYLFSLKLLLNPLYASYFRLIYFKGDCRGLWRLLGLFNWEWTLFSFSCSWRISISLSKFLYNLICLHNYAASISLRSNFFYNFDILSRYNLFSDYAWDNLFWIFFCFLSFFSLSFVS